MTAFSFDGHWDTWQGLPSGRMKGRQVRKRSQRRKKAMHLVETFGDQIDGKFMADAVYPGHILFPNGFREEGSQPGRHVVHLLQ